MWFCFKSKQSNKKSELTATFCRIFELFQKQSCRFLLLSYLNFGFICSGFSNNGIAQKSYSDALKSKSTKNQVSAPKPLSSQNTKNGNTTPELQNLNNVTTNHQNLTAGLPHLSNIPNPPIPPLVSPNLSVGQEEEERVKAECHKIYFRPELKERHPLTRPLRFIFSSWSWD